MSLTRKQEEGLKIVINRYKQKIPYTIIAGYAGTGKSFLVNAIVEAFNFSEEEVAYCSYTGKAALVLQNQGKNAVTLHKLLYYSYPDGKGGFIHKPKQFLDPQLKLIIVDEVSMCPKNLWNLLLKHRIYIIGLGDPFQLPPIGENTKVLDKPDIFLTEVMRQALDNDIIRYSMELREQKFLPLNLKGKNIRTHSKNELSSGMMEWSDQILCGKNSTRKEINKQMRKILNKKDILDNGDKLICTKNYWDICSNEGKGNFLVNGYTGNVNNIKIKEKSITVNFYNNEDNFGVLPLDYKLLVDGAPTIVKNKFGKVIKSPFVEMEYGYAITVHKAQGSQFNKVLVYDDYWKKDLTYFKWLYTAISRSIDKVVILL